jgi:transcriptional regulator with XRE-family HTH domain
MRSPRKTQARLRLVSSQPHLDLCNSSSFRAASPRGSAVLLSSISLTDEGAKPISCPISESVSPLPRNSEMRDAHVVMEPNIRKTEVACQRLSDTAFRNNLGMPRPKEMPSNLVSVGKRVGWWRRYRKIAQGKLAKDVGIAPSTLSDLENDRQDGSGKLHLIAAKLQLNAYYLETGKGEPEAEYSQEPPSGEVAWPLPAVPRHKVEKLNQIERSYVESAVLVALEDIEKARKSQRKG